MGPVLRRWTFACALSHLLQEISEYDTYADDQILMATSEDDLWHTT